MSFFAGASTCCCFLVFDPMADAAMAKKEALESQETQSAEMPQAPEVPPTGPVLPASPVPTAEQAEIAPDELAAFRAFSGMATTTDGSQS